MTANYSNKPQASVNTICTSLQAKGNTDGNTETQPLDSQETEDQKWLETSWCVLDLSTSDQQMFSDLHTPEQISIVAASYFTKQLRLFTDAAVTTKLLDDIFKLFMVSVSNIAVWLVH